MKWLLDLLVLMFNEGKKSKAIKVSISTMIIIIVTIFALGNKIFTYKEQLGKIPAMEKKIEEHDRIVQLIPQMADDIRWLTRSRRRE